ncbi:MAG: type IV secretion system protein DotC [Alphaproteobacteria bacterium]|nr:type IV secretion system protein DotC [Alphaproteobacteria bacterium]
MRSKRNLLSLGFICALSLVLGACSSTSDSKVQPLPIDNETPISTADEEPVEVGTILSYEAQGKPEDIEGELPFDIRIEALREAAISFGARGGLAKRTFEIREELTLRERYLSKVFDFRQLLIAAPSGLLIEPPIVTESMNAMLIDINGETAAVSDKIYNIIRNARIVSTPRTWQIYLEREWGEVLPPPDILTPQNVEERNMWIEYAAKGWEEGYKQANQIFEEDLARLEADYQGMIRYRMLLAQGMISPPYALQIDRGITGGGNEMRIGDRAVQITGRPQLITGSDSWKPASR